MTGRYMRMRSASHEHVKLSACGRPSNSIPTLPGPCNSFGESMVEDGILTTEKLGKSAETAQEEIAKLMTEKAWNDRTHPDHDALIARMNELYQHAYGGA